MDTDIMMEIRVPKEPVIGYKEIDGIVDGVKVASILYKTIGYKDKNIYITNVYTIRSERGKGYASQLLEHFVKEYGNEVSMELSCHPYDMSFSTGNYVEDFKRLQTEMAKWYERFGFVTKYKKEYGSDGFYDWKMIRNKNNI